MQTSVTRRMIMASNERTQISLSVPNDILDDFDRITGALERDRSWVMLRAFKTYLEGEGADLLNEATGIAELDRGEFHDIDDVLAEAETILASRGGKTAQRAS
jgi:predicted transcriptional regulator